MFYLLHNNSLQIHLLPVLVTLAFHFFMMLGHIDDSNNITNISMTKMFWLH